MSEKLKPCPFCGEVAGMVQHTKVNWSAVCNECGAEGPWGNPTAAIAAWNKRAQHAGEARERVAWGKYRYDMPQPAAVPEGWIPVSERMPERNQDVILALTTGAVLVGFYYGDLMGWDWPETDTDEDADAAVTHWQPMPAAPVAAAPQPREWDASATTSAGDGEV